MGREGRTIGSYSVSSTHVIFKKGEVQLSMYLGREKFTTSYKAQIL